MNNIKKGCGLIFPEGVVWYCVKTPQQDGNYLFQTQSPDGTIHYFNHNIETMKTILESFDVIIKEVQEVDCVVGIETLTNKYVFKDPNESLYIWGVPTSQKNNWQLTKKTQSLNSKFKKYTQKNKNYEPLLKTLEILIDDLNIVICENPNRYSDVVIARKYLGQEIIERINYSSIDFIGSTAEYPELKKLIKNK